MIDYTPKKKTETYQPFARTRKPLKAINKLPTVSDPFVRQTTHYPSRVTPGGDTSLKKVNMYTGSAMKGIGTLHKSNAVPVFTDEEAKSLSSMRR